MWHLGEVGDKHLVAHRASQADGQFGLAILEGFRGEHLSHGHDLRLAVRHLDAYGAAAGHGRDDADAQGGEAQRDVVLEAANFRHTGAVLGNNLKQRHGGSHVHLDFLDFDAVVAQRLGDALFVALLLLHIHTVGAHGGVLQQVERGEAVVGVTARGVVRIGDACGFYARHLSRCGRCGGSSVARLAGLRAAWRTLFGNRSGSGHCGITRVRGVAARVVAAGAATNELRQVGMAVVGIVVLVAVEFALGKLDGLHLGKQARQGLVGEHNPQHDENHVHAYHAWPAHQPDEPFVGLVAKGAARIEEGRFPVIGERSQQHREGEDGKQRHHRVGEEVHALVAVGHAIAYGEAPHHDDERRQSHAVDDEEVACPIHHNC